MNSPLTETLLARFRQDHGIAPRQYRLFATVVALLLRLGLLVFSSVSTCLGAAAALYLLDGFPMWAALAALAIVALWRMDALLRASWVDDGLLLSPTDFPDCHRLVAHAVKRSRGRRVTTIRLLDGFGLEVAHDTRVLARGRAQLWIGYELLQLIDSRELSLAIQLAVMQQRGHVGTSGWISRQRMQLQRIEATLPQAPIDALLARVLLVRGLRFFALLSIPVAREHVLTIDRKLSKTHSTGTIAALLSAIDMRKRYIDDNFWPAFWSRATIDPRPSYSPNVGVRIALRMSTQVDMQRALARAFMSPANEASPMPSLRERLDGLGAKPYVAKPFVQPQSAAERLLGARHRALLAAIDARWTAQNLAEWMRRFKTAERDRQMRTEAETQAQAEAAARALADVPARHASANEADPVARREARQVRARDALARANALYAKGAIEDAMEEAESWASAMAGTMLTPLINETR